jgi:hypothetical protein
MVCPHAAGVVALFVAHSETELSFEDVKGHLTDGIPSGRDCEGFSEAIFPNHAFGHGLINTLQSLQSLKKSQSNTL